MENDNRDLVAAHLHRMRITAVAFLVFVVAGALAAFLLPYRGSVLASPTTVTLVAMAAGLWVGFTANRDAAARLVRIRRAFAVHGDEDRLLRDHWVVYLAILLRLTVMIAAGLLIALWGLGPQMGFFLIVLAGVMIMLTWPTSRKTRLLLGRARALRESAPEGPVVQSADTSVEN